MKVSLTRSITALLFPVIILTQSITSVISTNTDNDTSEHNIRGRVQHQSKQNTPSILVTGATGRTGSLIYKELIDRGIHDVRALVRSVDKARKVLGCDTCDVDEGIYQGDVTDQSSLERAARGASIVIIASATSGTNSDEDIRAVEFDGVKNIVAALTQPFNIEMLGEGSTSESLRVVLISTMGTTQPNPSFGANIGFWKLNAEAFLGSSGVGVTIIKPCGLIDGPPNGTTLLVGHEDSFLNNKTPVMRSDVARVAVEAALLRSRGLRFDLCASPDDGEPTTDLVALLNEARWGWESTAVARDTIIATVGSGYYDTVAAVEKM